VTGPPARLEVDVRLRRPGQEHRYAFRTEAPITGVFGPSGAGKTTLLDLVAGLVRPTEGTITFRGEPLFDRGAGVDVPAHRRAIGMVFQDDRLFPHLTVQGNLRFGAGRAAIPDGAGLDERELVDLLNLGGLLRRRVRHLSGGERRRVTLGRALLSAPRLLLLDEPLTSLDGEHRREILGLIARIRDRLEIPMLYVTHDLTELLRLTDHLLIVRDGHGVGHGTLRELVRRTEAWQAVRELGPLNVTALTVHSHDEEAGLTTFVLGDRTAPPPPRLLGPLTDRPAGERLHASIRPEDVALSLEPVTGISIRNQLPGRVRTVTAHPDRALAEIDAGVPILVEISHRTVREMGLAPGRAVWCLIKSNAVRYVE